MKAAFGSISFENVCIYRELYIKLYYQSEGTKINV